MHPTVSIVIDNYNYGQFVSMAIDSALSQTYPRVEVVVVDDGSTDHSREAIRAYGGDVIAVLQDNGGQTSALNAGFARATGDIICFLDADDALYPSAAETAVALLAEPGVARAVWALHRVDRAGRILGIVPQGAVPGADAADILRHGDPHQFAIATTSSNAWSRSFLDTLFPLPAIEPVVGYGSAMADCLMAMCSLAFGSTSVTSEVHGRYLVHGGNDFARRDLYGQMAMHLAILPLHFDRVEAYARSRGIEADAEVWRRQSFWFRLERAVDALARCAPPEGHIVLAGEGWWLDVGAPFRAAPFSERDGESWGAPADTAEAIRHVDRARDNGARALAFLWPSFWWLDYFTGLDAHLRTSYRLAFETDDVIVFDLAGQPRS